MRLCCCHGLALAVTGAMPNLLRCHCSAMTVPTMDGTSANESRAHRDA